MAGASDDAPAADVSRADVGWNMLHFALPFAIAAAVAFNAMSTIHLDFRLLGAALLRGPLYLRRRLSNARVLDRVCAWLCALLLLTLWAPPLLLIAWGFSTYHQLSKLYGLTVALIGMALYTLACGLLRWRETGWQLVLSVRLLFTASLLCVFAFELWMVALSTPYTFIGVSAVLLAFNMLPVSQLAFLVTADAEGTAFTELAHVQREMNEAAARVGVRLIKLEQAPTRPPSPSPAAAAVAPQAASVSVASPSAIALSPVIVRTHVRPFVSETKEADTHKRAPSDLAVAQAVPLAASTTAAPSLRRVGLLYLLSLAVLFAYAIVIRYTVDDAPYLGFITAGAITAVDFCLLLSIMSGRVRSGGSALWYAIASRFILVFFGSQLYFMGHCLLYFLLSVVLAREVVDSWLPLQNEQATREEVVRRIQQGDWAQAHKQEQQATWIAQAIARMPLFRRLTPARMSSLLHALPTIALAFLTACFVMDLVVASRLVTFKIELQTDHEQWFAGVLTLLASLLLLLSRIMVRIYLNHDFVVSSSLVQVGALTYALIISCGLCFNYLDVFNDLLAALVCLFLPPLAVVVTLLYFRWIRNDYSWSRDAGARNPPRQTWCPAFWNGGLSQSDYLVMLGFLAVIALLVGFGIVASFAYDPWWLGFTLSGGVFVLLTTVMPVVQWFGVLSCSFSLVFSAVLSAAAFVGGCFLFWWVVLDAAVDSQTGWQMLFVLVLYPTLVLLVVGLWKWRDDNWSISLLVKLALGVCSLLIMLFFLAISLLYPPWEIGATGMMLFGIGIFFQSYLPYVQRWSPRVAKLLLVSAFGVILIFALSVGFTSGTGFIGFSIGWAGVEMLMLLFAYNIYYPIDPTQSAALWVYHYSASILPVFRYAAGSPGSNPLHVYNRRVGCIYAPIVSFYLWSVLSVYFIHPPVIGLGLSSLAIVALIVYSVQLSRFSATEIERALEFLGNEAIKEATHVQQAENDAWNQEQGGASGPPPAIAVASGSLSATATSQQLFLQMLARACELSAQAQLVRAGGGAKRGGGRISQLPGATPGLIRPKLSDEQAASMRGTTHAAEIAIDVMPPAASASPARVSGSSSVAGAANAPPLLSFILNESDADEFIESVESDASLALGLYTWRSAQADFEALSRSLPLPSFLCRSSRRVSSTPPFLVCTVLFHSRAVSRVGAYFLLEQLFVLSRSLWTSQLRFEVQVQVELMLQVAQLKAEKTKLMTQAMQQIKEQWTAAQRGPPPPRPPPPPPGAAPSAASGGPILPSSSLVLFSSGDTPWFDLSKTSLLRLLAEPAKARLVSSALAELEAALEAAARDKRAKRVAELRANHRRTLFAAGQKEEARQELRRDQQEQAAADALQHSVKLHLSAGKQELSPASQAEFDAKISALRSVEESNAGQEETHRQAEWLLSTRLAALTAEEAATAAELTKLTDEIAWRQASYQQANTQSEAQHLVQTTHMKEEANGWKHRVAAAQQRVQEQVARIEQMQTDSSPAAEQQPEMDQEHAVGLDQARSTLASLEDALIQLHASASAHAAATAAQAAESEAARLSELRQLDADRLRLDRAAHGRIDALQLVKEQHAERARLLEAEKQHWWAQRQSVRRTMESHLAMLEPVLSAGQCSFAASGPHLKFQRWYSCFECSLEGARGFCESCRQHCHPAGHQLRAHFSQHYCDCGWRQSVQEDKQPNRSSCRALHGPPTVISHVESPLTQESTSAARSSASPRPASSGAPTKSVVDGVLTRDNLSDTAAFKALSPVDQLQVLTRQCKQRGEKWTDPHFPPSALALYIDPDRVGGISPDGKLASPVRRGWESLVWRRASDHVKNPALFVPPFKPDVIKQGLLGDCYLLSALAVLTLRPDLLQNIFVTSRYSQFGIYAVRFFKNGVIRTVLVDDYFPCLPPDKAAQTIASSTAGNRKNAQLRPGDAFVSAFGRSLTSNELWVMVVEKAYAKLHSCLSFSTLVRVYGTESPVPIEQLRVGMQLLGEDGCAVTITRLDTSGVSHAMLRLSYQGGSHLVTPDHRVTLRCGVSPQCTRQELGNGDTIVTISWCDAGKADELRRLSHSWRIVGGAHAPSLLCASASFAFWWLSGLECRSGGQSRPLRFGDLFEVRAACLLRASPDFLDTHLIPQAKPSEAKTSVGHIADASFHERNVAGIAQPVPPIVRHSALDPCAPFSRLVRCSSVSSRQCDYPPAHVGDAANVVYLLSICLGQEAIKDAHGQTAATLANLWRIWDQLQIDPSAPGQRVLLTEMPAAASSPDSLRSACQRAMEFALHCGGQSIIVFGTPAYNHWLQTIGSCAGVRVAQMEVDPSSGRELLMRVTLSSGSRIRVHFVGHPSAWHLADELANTVARAHCKRRDKHSKISGDYAAKRIDRVAAVGGACPFVRLEVSGSGRFVLADNCVTHNCYEAIEAGCVDTGLVDLTGGIGDRVDLTSPATLQQARNGSLWDQMRDWFESGYLLGAGSPAGSDAESHTSKFGIVQGHAYSLLSVRQVDGHCLLRLRNPWARVSWLGKWSDGDSASWTRRLRRKLRFVESSDGSFWMEFADFIKHFEDVYVCRFFDRKIWGYHREIRGAWIGVSAGGCTNHYSVVHSPQYALVLHVPCDVVITLAQYDARADAKQTTTAATSAAHDKPKQTHDTEAAAAAAAAAPFAIGVEVYSNCGHRVSRRRRGQLVASNPSSFAFRREVTAQFSLPLLSGDQAYTVLAATLEPAQERTFIMQVYATQPIEFEWMPTA